MSTHVPLLQTWPAAHETAAHDFSHVWPEKSAVGLQNSPAAQAMPAHGSGWQAPRLHTLPFGQGMLKQLSTTQLPALGPKSVHSCGGVQTTW